MTRAARIAMAVMAFGVVSNAPAQAMCEPSPQWVKLIASHVVRYPLLQIPDLYKLLHQATMGSEHAVRDTAMVAEWMHRELSTMGDGPREPMVDSLGSPARLVRVHLRPFVLRGGNTDSLMTAFIQTANVIHPDTIALRCALATAVTLASRQALHWPADSLLAYFAARRSLGYPAVDHSEVFVRAYRPAYRVIAVPLLAAIFRGVRPGYL